MFLCNKKIPLTSPLHYDNCLITDSKEEADFFSSFYSKQCSLISSNDSHASFINYTAEKRLSTVALSVEAISKIT